MRQAGGTTAIPYQEPQATRVSTIKNITPKDLLQNFILKYCAKRSPGEVDAALKALQEEQHNIKVACTQAAALEVEARSPLTAKQRWRIPIVLVKLNKGKVLDAEDTKIWDGVSRNFQTTEDIEQVTTFTCSAQQAAKQTTQIPIHSLREVVEAVKPQYQQLDLTKVRGAGAGAGGSAGVDCKTVRTGAKLAHSDSHHRPMESPVRSPMPTPRAISRATSSRLLAGTATSQARAQCAAEDSHPTTKTAHKKMMKRGSSRIALGSSTSHNNSATNSKNNSRSNSRRCPHVNARLHLSGPRDAGDASQENSAGPEVDLSEWEGSPGIAGNTRESFVGMVAAQLSFLATAVSTKFKSPSQRYFSVKTEDVVSEGRVYCEVNGDAGPVPVQTSPPNSARVTGTTPNVELVSSLPRHLSSFISFLNRGKSSSRSLQSVKSEKRDERYSPEQSIPLSGNNVTAAAAPPCNPVQTDVVGREETMGEIRVVQGGAVPSKRRSYFGTLLASLVRADSEHAEACVSAGAHSGPLFTPQTDLVHTGDKNKPTGLTSWLPWGHSTASSATVVPINLAEYTRAQFAE